MLSLSLLVLFPLATVATLNGHCTGPNATGIWGEYGICIQTATCASYMGTTTFGACPSDPDNVKCCVIGDPMAEDPCGGSFFCTWTANGCPGNLVPGNCPGESNYEGCQL